MIMPFWIGLPSDTSGPERSWIVPMTIRSLDTPWVAEATRGAIPKAAAAETAPVACRKVRRSLIIFSL